MDVEEPGTNAAPKPVGMIDTQVYVQLMGALFLIDNNRIAEVFDTLLIFGTFSVCFLLCFPGAGSDHRIGRNGGCNHHTEVSRPSRSPGVFLLGPLPRALWLLCEHPKAALHSSPYGYSKAQ